GLERPRVLDGGTGTGAIALAIADEHPGARVTGVDTSPDALALARENAELTGLEVEIREGGVEAAAEGWELVVSNPPYVAAEELASLEPEVRDWEPQEALVDTGVHERLARTARTRFLVLEVGDGQAADLAPDVDMLLECVPELRGRAAVLARALLPGPFTLVLPNPARRYRWLAGETPDKIGVRVPELPTVAAAVLAQVGAVAATSANLAG